MMLSGPDSNAVAARPRPLYEALDAGGRPYVREARTVHELPTPLDRRQALIEALGPVAAEIGLQPVGQLPFGAPLWAAFLPEALAKKHASWPFLATRGENLSLDFCPSYASRG